MKTFTLGAGACRADNSVPARADFIVDATLLGVNDVPSHGSPATHRSCFRGIAPLLFGLSQRPSFFATRAFESAEYTVTDN